MTIKSKLSWGGKALLFGLGLIPWLIGSVILAGTGFTPRFPWPNIADPLPDYKGAKEGAPFP